MAEDHNVSIERSSLNESVEVKSGFFSFEKMISSTLIKILYVTGSVAITVSSLGMLSFAFQYRRIFKNELFWSGLALLILGNILWRIICEGWIIIFRIHEALVSISKNLKNQ